MNLTMQLAVAHGAHSSQPPSGPATTLLGACVFFWLIASAIQTVSYWLVFRKAGRRGWESIVPFYESWVRYRLAGKPGWWLFLALVPVVGTVLNVLAGIGLAKCFGRGNGFGVVLALLPFIGYPILAFSDAEYQPPTAGTQRRAAKPA